MPRLHLYLIILLVLSVSGCQAQPENATMKNERPPSPQDGQIDSSPEPGYKFATQTITEADKELARSLYEDLAHKSEENAERILAILTAQKVVAVDEPVRVFHLIEFMKKGAEIFIMGPKDIYGEFVNGHLASPKVPEGQMYPWMMLYDGPVLEGPGLDENFKVSVYRFSQPGRYEINWQFEEQRSNTLTITVK